MVHLVTPRRPLLRHLPVAVLLVLAGSCGGDAASPESGVDTWGLGDPAVRFGSVDDPASSLVPVNDLVLASDGSIWAAQAQDGEVLSLGADGLPRLRIGGLGQGPGEFAAVSRLGWIGDTLWVSDNLNRRISYFGPDGDARGSIPQPSAQVADTLQAVLTALVPDGALFVVGPGTAMLTATGTSPRGDDPVVITARDGTAPRVVAVRSGTRTRSILVAGEAGEIRAVSIVAQPWADGSLIATLVGGEGLVVVDRTIDDGASPPTYRVTRLALTGDTVWSTSREYAPVPVEAAHQDSLVRQFAQPPFDESAVRGALFLPATHPAATSVFAGRDGRIWVARERPLGATPRGWDVFAPDGRLEATVSPPPGVVLHAADEQGVWGVETDALDVPYLVRFSLPGG